jgi:membrane-associated phospholipid phosphatase
MFLEQFGQFACSVVVILAVAVLDPQGRRRALAIAIGCLASLALTYLLKDLFGRSRPFVAAADGSWQWRGPWQMSTAWTSFPSAHTPAAFALAAGLSWFYPRGRALFVTLAVITAAQRVLHTAHYLSDVIAGMGIGVFTARMTLHTKLAGRVIALAPDGARKWWLGEVE